ncbi:MAG: hypothetical protein AMS20_15835 [Gemmatimonas sp. SG8_28]|jgi:hypothetical protein|nr:MAG: hypothetical protein AMS20_15835 [Gemmatimonas sp. SG8_28]
MLKGLAKLAALVAIVVIAYPFVHYRTASPCGMLEKELVWQMEDRIEQAAEEARVQLEAFGADSLNVSDDVEAALEGVAAGIAAGAARAKVGRMSTTQCARELWRVTIGNEDPFDEGR